MDVPDDILLHILRLTFPHSSLRLTFPERYREEELMGVCRKWRELLCNSYTSASLSRVTGSVDAALNVLQTYRGVKHIQLNGGSPAAGQLMRTLAARGGLPQLTSFDLSIEYRREALDDLTYFLSRRTSLEALQLSFRVLLSARPPQYTWQDLHAFLEAVDFGSLPRLEHLTLKYSWLYSCCFRNCNIPFIGGHVPVSRTLVGLQQHEQEQQQQQGRVSPPKLKTFHLRLSPEAQVQRLPPWLGELPEFSSLSMNCDGGPFLKAPPSARWHLLHSLAVMSTLQELHLRLEDRHSGARELASLGELRSLKRLRLSVEVTDPAVPQMLRPFPRLEELDLKLVRPHAQERGALHMQPDFFAFAPNLRFLDLWSDDELAWPGLACLERLTSLRVGREEPPPAAAGGVGGGRRRAHACCVVGGLPALRKLELRSCKLLPVVGGLSGLDAATAVTFFCQCQPVSLPIRSYAEYVQAGCECLLPGGARQVFRGTRGQVAPA